MTRTSKTSLARRVALAILATAGISASAHAQQLLSSSLGYSTYGTNVTSAYTNYGVAVPYGRTSYGTGVNGTGNGGTILYPGQPALGTSVLGNSFGGQTVLGQPGTSTSIGPQGSSTGNAATDQAQQQTGAPAVEPVPVAGAQDGRKPEGKALPKKAPGASNPTIGTGRSGLAMGYTLHGFPAAVSGDTLSFGGQRVKLAGIRAPGLSALCRSGATAWACGEQSRESLQGIAASAPVTCIVIEPGETPIASCQSGREDLSALVVAEGAAFPVDMTLDSRMREARADGRGVWAPPGR